MKISPFPAALLAAASSVGAANETGAPGPLTLGIAQEMISEGQAPQVVRQMRELSQKNPGDLYVLYNYGIAAYASGDFLEASRAFADVSGSSDEKLSSLALTQMGNAQYRLGESLRTKRNLAGCVLAWERSVEYYERAIAEKSLSHSRHNLDVVTTRLKEALRDFVNEALDRADRQRQTDREAATVGEAFEKLEKLAEMEPENRETREQLEDVRGRYSALLAKLARENRRNVKAALAQIEKSSKSHHRLRSQAQSNREAAAERYQLASEVDPKNEALKAEIAEYRKETANDLLGSAERQLAEAERFRGRTPFATELEKQKLMAGALEDIEGALAVDAQNERGLDLKQSVLKKLEQSHLAAADMQRENGDRRAEADKGRAVDPYADALQQYQAALDINPDNQPARDSSDEVREKLAEAYVEAGKNDVQRAAEIAGDESGARADTSNVGAETAALQRQIGHLEKAAQSFAQAESLDSGKNNAVNLEAEASSRLAELRNALDGLLAESDEGSDPGAGESAADGRQTPPKSRETEGLLSFSDIRGGAELEGRFENQADQRKVRDW